MDTHVLSNGGLSAKPVQEWIRNRAAAGDRRLRLDLGALTVPSSDLLVLLTLAAREAGELGVDLVAVRVRDRVRSSVLDLDLEPVLRIEDAGRV